MTVFFFHKRSYPDGNFDSKNIRIKIESSYDVHSPKKSLIYGE